MRWQTGTVCFVASLAATVAACGSSTDGSVFVQPVGDDAGAPPADPGSFSQWEGPQDSGGACKPRTCADAKANCGPIGDGCGGALECGTCAAPALCGGGGVPSQCGGGTVSSCKPKSCLEQGANCGPVADGCGGIIPSCGGCTTPDICGGGGVPSQCGGGLGPGAPTGTCVPRTCEAAGANCGPVADGCGGLLACGTCTAPGQFCGAGGTPSVCGGPTCTPRTCAEQNADCGPVADGCGGLLACGTCSNGNVCGGGGVSSKCGGAPPCTGLCKQQTACGAGATTSISGTVYSPAGNLPIYGALVYVPNAAVAPFTERVSCDQCASTVSGTPLVSTTTGTDGSFKLDNMPVGTNIPVVIQLGRWRRQITVSNVGACVNTPVAKAQTTLPKTKAEGDIPLTAISTGDVDGLECVLRKIGIADSEFTSASGNGRVRLYQDNGARIDRFAKKASSLYGDQNEIDKFDMVIFGCVGSQEDKPSSARQRIINYTNKGGRVFATHYSYVWLYNTAPFSSTGTWVPETATWNDPVVGNIDTSFPKGAAFASWLGGVGALSNTTPPQISIDEARHDLDAPLTAPAQGWISTNSPAASVQHYTFNTPWGQPPANQCGRVLFSDFHVTASTNSNNVTFPGECNSGPLTPQEKVLAFMLFDLASCVGQDAAPTCTPKTCAQQGIACGKAGDGCGGTIDCAPCPNGTTCGGGGVANQCGAPTCTKTTCAAQKAECGVVGDGCGGTLDCGTCAEGLNCGGGGANTCGAPTCAPRTCAQQGIDCGAAGDGCGNLIQCPECADGTTCGGGGVAGKCGAPKCTPLTCAQIGANCGPAADGCGALLDCGVCPSGQSCGAAGVANQCGASGGLH